MRKSLIAVLVFLLGFQLSVARAAVTHPSCLNPLTKDSENFPIEKDNKFCNESFLMASSKGVGIDQSSNASGDSSQDAYSPSPQLIDEVNAALDVANAADAAATAAAKDALDAVTSLANTVVDLIAQIKENRSALNNLQAQIASPSTSVPQQNTGSTPSVAPNRSATYVSTINLMKKLNESNSNVFSYNNVNSHGGKNLFCSQLETAGAQSAGVVLTPQKASDFIQACEDYLTGKGL